MEEVLAGDPDNLNGSIEENKAVVTRDPLPAIMEVRPISSSIRRHAGGWTDFCLLTSVS